MTTTEPTKLNTMKYELFIFRAKGLFNPEYKKITGDYKGLRGLMDILNNPCVLISIKDEIRVVKIK